MLLSLLIEVLINITADERKISPTTLSQWAVGINSLDGWIIPSWGWINLVIGSTDEMYKHYGFIYVDKHNKGRGTLDAY
jgi:hypothetical protein